MSDTPRTDHKSVTFEMGLPALNCTQVVDADFARQLERELTAMLVQMMKERRELMGTIERQGNAIEELNRELAAVQGYKLNYQRLNPND